MSLVDKGKNESRFFVRTAEGKEQVKSVFGEVEFVEVPEISGEVGFLTKVMSEEEYEKKASGLNIIQRIRVV